MGINPGNDEEDWGKTNYMNDEETRERNFQEIYGRSRGSKTRMTKLKTFLGQSVYDRTTHTELFFWCSKNLDRDFKNRYSTSFNQSPHLEFCVRLNMELINRVEPKAIFFESLDKISLVNDYYKLKKIRTHRANSRVINEYLLDDRHRLLNFDHLSAGPPASLERTEVSKVVRQLIQ